METRKKCYVIVCAAHYVTVDDIAATRNVVLKEMHLMNALSLVGKHYNVVYTNANICVILDAVTRV